MPRFSNDSHQISATADWSDSRGTALQTTLVVVAAIALAVVGLWSFIYFGEKPVKPVGTVEQAWVYPIHRESKFGGGQAGQAPGVQQNFDQLFVIEKVKIDNPGKIPIYIRDISASVTFPDGPQISHAAGRSDFNQVFVAYPETAEHKGFPLLRETNIAPGSSAEGTVIFNYPLTREQWATHTALDITVSFVHQADIILKSPQS